VAITANVKLESMASDVLGVSGRAMLEARESGMYQKGSFVIHVTT
jgi:hypothetical protein